MNGEGHLKSLRQQPASLGMNRRAARINILCDHMVNRTGGTDHPRRKHTCRPAEEKVHKVRVVNVQVKQRAANVHAAGVGALLAPARHLRQAPKPRDQNFAVSFLRNDLLEPAPARPESHAHGRHEKTRGCLGDFQYFPGRRRRARQRFFTKDVLARPERCDGLLVMQRRGRAKIHQLHFRIGQDFRQLAKHFHLRPEIEVVGLGDVSRDAWQDAVHRQPRGVAHRDDPRRRIGEIRAQMRHAHEAQADHRDVDSFRRPFQRFRFHWLARFTRKFFRRPPWPRGCRRCAVRPPRARWRGWR